MVTNKLIYTIELEFSNLMFASDIKVVQENLLNAITAYAGIAGLASPDGESLEVINVYNEGGFEMSKKL